MGKKILLIAVALALVATCKALTYSEIEKNVFFQVFNNESQRTWNSTFNGTFESQGCSNATKVSFLVHGWKEGLYISLWIPHVVRNMLKQFGGCVVVMDYSFYSVQDYFGVLTANYQHFLSLLVKKMRHVDYPDRFYMFGFSFGARLAAGAGTYFNDTKGPLIPRMDLCDPARPGFDDQRNVADPKRAAKNTACIHTSNDYGTQIYNCSQNFRMGRCGIWQDGRLGYPKGSHGLCPYFYNATFISTFAPNNINKCTANPVAAAVNATSLNGVIVGPRNSVFPIGQIFVPTAMCYPYVVVNGTIKNFPKGTSSCPNDVYLPVANVFK